MEYEQIPVSDLKPYPRNAKKHPEEQIARIMESLRAFGFRQPIVIDRGNVVVIGHGRLEAAKRLGMTHVPIQRCDDLTEEQVKALRLADNKTNESEWDFDALTGELKSIDEMDMSLFGFDVEDMDFEAFDGSGDGGGSQISNGTKVRVTIGALMFDIDDPTHEIYQRTKAADAEEVSARLQSLIAGGDLL